MGMRHILATSNSHINKDFQTEDISDAYNPFRVRKSPHGAGCGSDRKKYIVGGGKLRLYSCFSSRNDPRAIDDIDRRRC